MKKQFEEGPKAKNNFEGAMAKLFKAKKPPKHKPKRRERGKD
jgi:hypothetical protein